MRESSCIMFTNRFVGVAQMRIIEFLKKLDERFPTLQDKNRATEQLYKNELKICDLDYILLLLSIIFYCKIDTRAHIFEKKQLIATLSDSSFAKYLAPELFKSDLILADENKWQEEVTTAIAENISELRVSKDAVTEIYNHELLNPIDIKALSINKTNISNSANNVQINIIGNEHYSFALSQTNYKVIDEIIITNTGDENIKDAKLIFACEPNYLEFSSIDIPLINAHQKVSITEFNITPHLDELINLTEKISGFIIIKLAVNEDEIVSLTHQVNYFSYNTWFERIMDGSTALFITPNDVAIQNVITLASKELQRATGNPSMCGYQMGSKENVVSQIKALYDVLFSYGIAYSEPPSSFENVGQKVRMPHEVVANKIGTCLDLSLLFASCLENMGLDPFVVLISGHAFVGVFLDEVNFPTTCFYDASKALEMNSEEVNDLLFIECVSICAGETSSFEESCKRARTNVVNSLGDPNFKIIDVIRARSNGFLPLPIGFDDVERMVVDYEVAEQNKIRLARKKYDYKGEKLELSEAELNKFDIWEKKLLDLSKRNQLINYKIGGRGLQLYYYDLNDLYSAFECKNKYYDLLMTMKTDNHSFELPELTVEKYDQLKADFAAGRINLVFRTSAQLSSLRFFEKERKKLFEETGSNILYLSLGFIRYFENEKSVNPLFAPVILVPIDLKKQSKDSYRISGREEPPFLNISIFEYFHQEFGMKFDDLLAMNLFDGDVNVDAILNTVAEKLTKLSRTSIVRTSAINVYNFSKAVMWSDIKFRREDLAKNKMIKSIINKKFMCDDDLSECVIDDNNDNPSDLAIPLPADSSQIIAIKECGEGKSFILQGPPGTGKSQTITNMIVNAMYHGKTVLFVAEKMAALEVVQKRLNQLSLGRFALEAHSAKADKSSLMEQFGERVKLSKTVYTSEEYLEYANKIKTTRAKLNRVINLLHKTNGYFLSFYDSFVNYLDLDEDVQIINVDDQYVKHLNVSEYQEASRLCDGLYSQILSNAGYISNPFLFYRNPNYIPTLTRKELLSRLDEYKTVIVGFIDKLKLFNERNGLNIESTEEKIEQTIRLLKEERTATDCLSYLVEIDFESINDKIVPILEQGTEYQKIVTNLRNDFRDELFGIDAKQMIDEHGVLLNSFFVKRIVGLNKLVKKIKPFAKNPKSISKKNLITVLEKVYKTTTIQNYLLEEIAKYQIIFGDVVNMKLQDYNFERFSNQYCFTRDLVSTTKNVLGLETTKELINKIKCYSLQNKNELVNAFDKLKDCEALLSNEAFFDFSFRKKHNITFTKLNEMIDEMYSRMDYLQNWCILIKFYNECKEHNLNEIIGLVEKQDVIEHNLELIYKKSVFYHIITKAIEGDEEGSFSSIELKNTLEYYRDLLKTYKELTIKETAARASANTPQFRADSPSSSEQGILNKAINNRCRGKAIRQLFSEVPNILTRLFPVFLMSPISCAQYLSPDMPKFDIVIFDEASQMPTSEAVGAIARGNSLIVVGDSKQMPPTSFFQNKGPDDIDADLVDEDSILEDCSVIVGMPSRLLNWHYRSKHESLIRFSNAKFYGNSLITFPSPNDRTTKVSFVNTHGVYSDKRTNEIEAKAIVKEIERRLRSPELKEKSIGVVTFSAVQQDLVDNLLQDMFARHKDLERFNLEREEPIIVKNLENIQGDERDVILFSICYGPDKNKVMRFNFGPINNKGGEKRLNVAISRARYEMMVFASFEPELLNTMKTESVGAKELRNFLRYAKDGNDALVLPNGATIENRVGFEKKIAERLEERGYSVDIDVGKSSFRVDVGVVDPDNDNNYILGILCDSYSYQSALTSRDRNIVQPTTLEFLGWNLVRVWSFDYLDNPDATINKICELIEDIRAHPENYKNRERESQQMNIEFVSEEPERLNFSKEYTPYMEVHNIYGTSDNNQYTAKAIVEKIMKMEAPISKEVLRNRYANAIGALRAGDNIQQDVKVALSMIGARRNTNNAKTKMFFWLNGQDTNLDYYRIGGEKPRSMDDVPKEEIIVAIRETLLNDGPISRDDLKKYVAKAFGIKAVGRLVDVTIDDCIEYYLSKDILVKIDGGLRIGLKGNNK